MMKKILTVLMISLLAACSPKLHYIQLYETESPNTIKTPDYYTYENDTLRVDYVFWADAGVMSFRIINKSSKPLYVDWFKSSFISNYLRYQYWDNKEKTEINFDAVSRRNSISFPSVIGYSGDAVATRTKPEKVSFIPPRSYIIKLGYYLTTHSFSKWDSVYTKKTEPRHDNPKITTTIYSKQFTKQTSPLDFRNFLTLSYKEDFTTEFYVDNEFFVKSITSMERDHFWDNPYNTNAPKYNDYRDYIDHFYTITRFKKPTDFYFTSF